MREGEAGSSPRALSRGRVLREKRTTKIDGIAARMPIFTLKLCACAICSSLEHDASRPAAAPKWRFRSKGKTTMEELAPIMKMNIGIAARRGLGAPCRLEDIDAKDYYFLRSLDERLRAGELPPRLEAGFFLGLAVVPAFSDWTSHFGIGCSEKRRGTNRGVTEAYAAYSGYFEAVMPSESEEEGPNRATSSTAPIWDQFQGCVGSATIDHKATTIQTACSHA